MYDCKIFNMSNCQFLSHEMWQLPNDFKPDYFIHKYIFRPTARRQSTMRANFQSLKLISLPRPDI
jgi:hypothetical protein